MRPKRAVRIATRKSPLALWQARHARDLLRARRPGLGVELREIVSAGDRTERPLAAFGGKGLFAKELEEALLRGEADLAVHSIKDMTAAQPAGLVLAAVCAREDARDALVCNRFDSLAQLPSGAVVGTCSLRRRSQLLAAFPHLRAADLRGNVGTRLGKLDAGEFDAIVLAVAGLKRLGLADRIREIIAPEVCLPAAGQGAIGLQCRADDARVLALAAPLNCAEAADCVAAERAVNAGLGGDCHLPLAAHAELTELRGGEITLRARVGAVDGSRLLRGEKTGARAEAAELGRAVAAELLARGAAEILADVRAR